MKSYWTTKHFLTARKEDVLLTGSEKLIEIFKASDVRKEIAILNQKHKEDVNDWLAKFEAITETNNKEIELRKSWFMFMYNNLPIDANANDVEELLNLAFTKPTSEIKEEMK